MGKGDGDGTADMGMAGTQEASDKVRLQQRDSPHHDVLVLNPHNELYQFQVEPDLQVDAQPNPRKGEFLRAPVRLERSAHGHRKVMHIAGRAAAAGGAAEVPAQPTAGIAFGTLPIRPEPAASGVCCYLINTQRLDYKNPWIRSEWNDSQEDDPRQEPEPAACDAPLELLIAGSNGRVYYLWIDEKSAQPRLHATIDDHDGEPVAGLRELDLSADPDVWYTLRNGCVVGRATYGMREADQPEGAVPLVNITSLK